jgi:hypothetical protein
MPSQFNAEAFMGQTTTSAMETSIKPISEGVHPGQVTKLEIRHLDPTDRNPNGSYVLDVTWEVLSEVAKKDTGLDHPTARQGIFLDVNAQGGLDSGPAKNVQLGRLREAVGQNKAGKSWSFNHLMGATADLLIAHRADKNDPETTYAEVKKVAPFGATSKGASKKAA